MTDSHDEYGHVTMDLRQCEILLAIAETGSFTAAGRKLNVAQSAISRHVLLLEEELGEPLFLRVGSRVRMTPAAEALVQLAFRIFSDMRETITLVTDRTKRLVGTVRLGAEMPSSSYWLPQVLKDLRRAHPDLAVSVTTASAAAVVDRIRSGASDIGFVTLPATSADLVTVPVLREQLILVTSTRHRFAKQKSVTASDIGGESFVLPETQSNTRKVIDVFFGNMGIQPTVAAETENAEFIKSLVRIGVGISIVPYSAVHREIHSGELFCALIDGHDFVQEWGWIYPRSNRVPRAITELLAAFANVKDKNQLGPMALSRGRKGLVHRKRPRKSRHAERE